MIKEKKYKYTYKSGVKTTPLLQLMENNNDR